MTAQDLKNAILQLAVQGKLVPQDPNDEPASELLKRIKAEKERLIKKGKNKKEKALPPITEEEMPFEIPDNWEWVRIGDIWSVINGDRGQNYPAKSTLSHTGIPFISALNLNGKTVINDDNLLCLSETQYQKLGNGKLVQGDIVVCIRGSLGKHGRYPFEKGAIASSLVILRSSLNATVLDNLLMLYLDAPLFFCEIKRFDNGTAQPNLAAKSLERFLIPLPPLAEQQRIVAKIEELMPLVEKYGKAEERLTALNAEFPDKLRKSILQQAIQGKLTERDPADEPASELLKRIRAEKERLIKEGKIKKEKPLPPITEEEEPFEIPDEWVWVRFSSIINYMSTGPYGSMLHKSDYVSNGIPLVNPANIVGEHIIPSERMMVSKKTTERLSSYKLQKGMIVMGRRGEMGRCAVVTDAEDGWLCGTGSFFMEPSSLICCDYLIKFFASVYAKHYLGGESVGSTMNNLNHTILSKMPVPLPPLAEQQRIVDRVNELLAVCDELK